MPVPVIFIEVFIVAVTVALDKVENSLLRDTTSGGGTA